MVQPQSYMQEKFVLTPMRAVVTKAGSSSLTFPETKELKTFDACLLQDSGCITIFYIMNKFHNILLMLQLFFSHEYFAMPLPRLCFCRYFTPYIWLETYWVTGVIRKTAILKIHCPVKLLLSGRLQIHFQSVGSLCYNMLWSLLGWRVNSRCYLLVKELD